MPTFEEEYKRFWPMIMRISNFSLLGKKIEIWGKENFIKEGPNIIIGNHSGSHKDVAILFKVVPRPIFFTANKMIFNRAEFNSLFRKHLRRHMKSLGLFVNMMLTPAKALFVRYVSSNIAKIGTIPVDLDHRRREAIEQGQDYLRKGRAIIALQGRGRVHSKDPHPYVKKFRKGASIMAYNLYVEEDVSVPVTPMAIFGTHIPFAVPKTIIVNVGQPMCVKDYLVEGAEETIERFRAALEARVKTLFGETFRAR